MLLCLTANHRNASFDLLEKLSFGAPTAARALVTAQTGIAGAVVLATCNRFEAYLEVSPAGPQSPNDTIAAILAAVGSASGIAAELMNSSITILTGDQVVEHLFSVSAGLESVVVGEDEISGQVRRALEQAREAGTTSSGLEQLFQRASTTSRFVKSATEVGTAGRSLVRLALELASSRVTDWADARVLMIGTGSYAGASLAALRDRGAENVTVFSPSGRAPKFALSHGIRFSTDLVTALAASDVIVSCTTVVEHVITPQLFPVLTRKLVIDLGLPRNVDPAVGELEGIELLDLETISLHAPLDALNATSNARTLVGKAAAAFSAAEAEQVLAPAVVALRKHVFDLLDDEIERARTRGDSSAQTEAALRHLAGVLLHTPSVRARELARSGNADAFTAGLTALYGITVASPIASISASVSASAQTIAIVPDAARELG